MIAVAVLTIVKATLVCGLVFLLSHLCRRARASIRHLLFALAFSALIIIPGSGLALPTVSITMPARATAPLLPTETQVPIATSSRSAGPLTTAASSVLRVIEQPRSVTIAQVLTAIWVAGVALFLMPMAVGFWQVRRLRRSAVPWSDGQALVQKLGVRGRVEVLLHENVNGPMTCGVLEPAIVLPVGARHWDQATLRAALRHEIEHVARWDFVTQCVSRMVCAAYWFHPLVWAAWRRLRLEAERACDDAGLQESDAGAYASLLVGIAKQELANSYQSGLAMASRDDLAVRVAAVLDHDRARGRLGRRHATRLIVTASLAMLGVAPITFAREGPQPTPTTTAAPVRFESVSIRRNTGSGAPAMRPVDGGVWTATNLTVRSLLIFAFGPPNRIPGLHHIENSPEWIDSDRFDIVARMPPGETASPERVSHMFQSLLADRFKLVAHLGTKDLPVYALVRARPDGGLGPRMMTSQFDCGTVRGEPSPCGLSGRPGRLTGRGLTLAKFVAVLPRHVVSQVRFDRPVIDRTGLSGAFDFTVEWTPDPVSPEILAPSSFPPRLYEYKPYAFPLELNAPTFLKMLEEQLGLRLDNQLAPEPVLVIDQIEQIRN